MFKKLKLKIAKCFSTNKTVKDDSKKHSNVKLYKLTSPSGEIHRSNSGIVKLCKDLKLNYNLLKKHEPNPVPKIKRNHPTVGWKIEEIK